VTIPDGGAEGILLTHGNRHGGYAFWVADGRVHYVHNHLGLDRFTVSSSGGVVPGNHTLAMVLMTTGGPDFSRGYGSPADVHLFVDGQLVGVGSLPHTVPNLFGIVGLSCGYAAYDSVDPSAYAAPFTFTGTIHDVVLDVTGTSAAHPDAEMTRLMTQQ
jgi:arylsulfatase